MLYLDGRETKLQRGQAGTLELGTGLLLQFSTFGRGHSTRPRYQISNESSRILKDGAYESPTKRLG